MKLLAGARLLDPTQKQVGDRDRVVDLLIEDGKISAIDRPGAIRIDPARGQVERVDLAGKWLVPGLIDMHVHLREPGHEYKETIETGTRAAVAGGFTSVACMANTSPVNDSPYVTAFIRERAKATAHCRVFPIGALSKGLKGEELAEIGGMIAEGAVAISDDGMPVMNSYLMRKAMDYCKTFGVTIISHAEDAHLVGQGVMNEGALSNALGLRGNPAAAEEIMVAREIALCRLTRAPIHIAHLSTAVGLEHVRRARAEGLPVTAEVSPHHLTLTENELRSYHTHYKMAPPLRTERDVEALRGALAKGEIDAIASDHAPHGLVDKGVEFDLAACGIIGLQTSVPVTLRLVHEGVLTPLRWVEAMSSAPARILRIDRSVRSDQGVGSLAIGALADVTVIDPDVSVRFDAADICSKSANSPFLGLELKGRSVMTWIGGRLMT
jgi:dihydroorotase